MLDQVYFKTVITLLKSHAKSRHNTAQPLQTFMVCCQVMLTWTNKKMDMVNTESIITRNNAGVVANKMEEITCSHHLKTNGSEIAIFFPFSS